MDWHELAVGAVGVLLVLFGAVLKTLWGATQKLATDLRQLEKAMPETYVRRDDLRDWKNEILSAIGELRDELKGKVDKS